MYKRGKIALASLLTLSLAAAALQARDKAKSKTTGNDLPSLSTAREVGRAQSNLLNAKPLEESVSKLVPTANLSDFNKVIAPLFKEKCVACHGPKKVKGKFRIDKLNPDLLNGADVNRWLEVYEVLSNSEMPPDDETDYHLADADRSKIVDWLGTEVRKASQVRRNEKGHSSFRRMARYEYNHALQDLLGLPYDFVDRLVTETVSEDGFRNSSEHLKMSGMLFETYRKIGLQALKKATVSGEQAQPVTYTISMQEALEEKLKKAKPGKIFNMKDDNYKNKGRKAHLVNQKTGAAIESSSFNNKPNSSSNPAKALSPSPVVMVLNKNQSIGLNLGNHLPDEGIMRISLRASRRTMNKNEYAGLRLSFGASTSNNAKFREVISKGDKPVAAAANKPQMIHFDIPLSEIRRNPFRKDKATFPNRDEHLDIRLIANSGKLQVLIEHIEISGPYYEQWPPKTHSALFINSKNKSDENKYCREILKRFMVRSWRRPVATAEVEKYATFFGKYRSQFNSFEEAMLEVLATVLASPEFLYLNQTKETAEAKSEGTSIAKNRRLKCQLFFVR